VDASRTDRRSAFLARAGGTLALFIVVALGACWTIDRRHARETPRWTPDSFVSLREAPGAPETWAETWVVAVHLDCPHCRASLSRLASARDARAPRFASRPCWSTKPHDQPIR